MRGSLVLLLLLVCSLAVRGEVDDEDSVLQGVKVTSTIDSSTEKSLKTSQQVYDEDEFVGFEQVKPKEVKKEPSTPASPLETEIPLPPPRTNYYLEIVYISFILVYIVNYWIGKRKNEQIATAWASAVSKAFKSNFSKVGEGKNIGIVKESQNLYKLKATGRINCIGVQATLDLRKRHDLFSLIVELFYKNEDTVTLDILMNDDAMDSYVFAVVKKKDEKKFRKSVPDVPLFAPGSASPPPGFPSSFVVCSECEELTSDFLNSEAQVILTKYEGLFKRLHFSDQAVLSPSYKKTLQFVFRLPDKESDMEGIHILTRMAFYYIDLVAKTTLSKQAKQKATNNRTKALAQASKQTHEQRQEAAQQRKLAKLQKEKAALEKLSPEEQRKAEEKIQKREMKKRMPKFKVSFG